MYQVYKQRRTPYQDIEIIHPTLVFLLPWDVLENRGRGWVEHRRGHSYPLTFSIPVLVPLLCPRQDPPSEGMRLSPGVGSSGIEDQLLSTLWESAPPLALSWPLVLIGACLPTSSPCMDPGLLSFHARCHGLPSSVLLAIAIGEIQAVRVAETKRECKDQLDDHLANFDPRYVPRPHTRCSSSFAHAYRHRLPSIAIPSVPYCQKFRPASTLVLPSTACGARKGGRDGPYRVGPVWEMERSWDGGQGSRSNIGFVLCLSVFVGNARYGEDGAVSDLATTLRIYFVYTSQECDQASQSVDVLVLASATQTRRNNKLSSLGSSDDAEVISIGLSFRFPWRS
ncbi:hypothetical protein BJ912DRAFT_932889 [Pholiota molesta]|nr:hypothetical protein BJ912DRAFT_932889 [Pholiota molesta]